MPIKRPKPTRRRPQGLCLDRGYDYDEVRALAEEFGFTCHIRSRGEERALKREAGFRARRWVVERTHSWLHRFRRILVRWENGPTRTWRCSTSHAPSSPGERSAGGPSGIGSKRRLK